MASGTTEELRRQAEGRERVYVEVVGAGDGFGTVLSAMDVVDRVDRVDRGDLVGEAWELEANEDLREALFNLAMENGWKLLEMRRERVSLEDVFRRLTT